MSKVKTFKELMVDLRRGYDPARGWAEVHLKGVYRIPLKHIRSTANPQFYGNVKKYARWLKKGRAKTVPPIVVYRGESNKHFYVYDGLHRLKAHRLVKRKSIKAKVDAF